MPYTTCMINGVSYQRSFTCTLQFGRSYHYYTCTCTCDTCTYCCDRGAPTMTYDTMTYDILHR